MITNGIQRLLTAVVIFALFAFVTAAVAADKAEHHDGQQLLGNHIKNNGHHDIHKKGLYTTSVEVKNGKIAALHVRHSKDGDVKVTKYKTNKKMAQAEGHQYPSFLSVQDQYIGTVWIGYSYIDQYGVETIYWFPYDMILDGITGAIDYVPA